MLGVSNQARCPCLRARSGSMHGYDVTDPRQISEELGEEAGVGGWRGSSR